MYKYCLHRTRFLFLASRQTFEQRTFQLIFCGSLHLYLQANGFPKNDQLNFHKVQFSTILIKSWNRFLLTFSTNSRLTLYLPLTRMLQSLGQFNVQPNQSRCFKQPWLLCSQIKLSTVAKRALFSARTFHPSFSLTARCISKAQICDII